MVSFLFSVVLQTGPPCKSPFEEVDGKWCLKLTDTALNWTASQAVCQSLGGNLVTIDSLEMNLAVESYTAELHGESEPSPYLKIFMSHENII